MKKKSTQFKWLVTMLLLVTAMVMPKMAWAETYDQNGFAEDCSYQPATLTTDQYDINGDGTKDEVYEIGNAGQLYWFAGLVNGPIEGVCTGGLTQNKSANAVLTADITVNNDVLYYDGTLNNNVSGFYTWTPIGYLESYTGTFDGQGHTISGLYFNNSGGMGVGLFGGNSGTIKNVGVVDSYFCGNDYVGGVCGGNHEGGTITGCYNTGTVSGNDYVGGVCGDNFNATITGCYNTGAVSGKVSYVGGVCGCNSGGTITGCYTNKGGVCINEEGTITGCYYLANNDDGNGGKTEEQFKSDEVCTLLNNALKDANASVRFYQGGTNYPELFMNVPSLVDDVYQISNKEELYAFAQLVNKGETSANAELTADITVNTSVLKYDGTLNNNGSGFETWIPIGYDQKPYAGTFDGQGHTISGLYFNYGASYSYVGLFGSNSGTIKNVGVVDSYFCGKSLVGGVCGQNNGGTITGCYNTGTISGNQYVGGVCGYNTINISTNSSGTITGCYNTGVVSGNVIKDIVDACVGGVCGRNGGTITNCYYLSGTATGGIDSNDMADSAEAKTTTQFASGEVCYLLNEGKTDGTQRWYQNLAAVGGDAYPHLNDTDKENTTVYGAYIHGEATLTYRNDNNNTHAHAYDSKAHDEENGNHDMSYDGQFTWTDNDNNATATAIFTCSVCGKVVEPELTVEHDDSHTNTEADCLNNGFKYYKTSYAFDGNTITDKYSQTLKALGHDMPVNASLNPELQIYQKVCQRNGCGVLLGYYATSDGNVVANETSGGFVADALTLADAKTYDNQAVFTATNFTYTRTFSNTNWTTWYVPFELKLTEEICSKFAFSRINNVHQYDTDNDGNADKTVVESFRQTEGVTLKANYPYLVKALSESDLKMELNLKNVKPALAKAESIDCQSVDYKYVFTGTYNEMDDSGSGSTDPYTLCEGNKWLHFRSLSPMRHYLTIQSRDASSASPAAMRSILLSIIGEEDTTGIVKIYDEQRRASETYDLSGRRLPAGSQRGLVIENGKVVFKK